jgi:hypothetical protein
MSEHKTRWTKSGQPVLGTVLRLPQTDGNSWAGRVVGQLYGRGGNSDLVGIIVEAVDDGERYKFSWPLTQGDRQCTRVELTWA